MFYTFLVPLILLSQRVDAQTVVSRIIYDSDASIDYEPSQFWASSVAAQANWPKIDPSLYNGTYHNGTHVQPTTDSDDVPGQPEAAGSKRRMRRRWRKRSKGAHGGGDDGNEGADVNPNAGAPASTPTPSSSSTTTTSPMSTAATQTQQQAPATSPQTSTPASAPASQNPPASNPPASTTINTGAAENATQNKGSSTAAAPGSTTTVGIDEDDPNFVPDVVTMTFRFTGQSAEIHALVPNFIFPGMISTTNVTFTLDGVDTGLNFVFKPVAGAAGPTAFSPRTILNIGALADGPHTLVVKLAPDSILLFNYLNYTAFDTDPLPGPSAAKAADTSTSTPISRHNVVTFGLAVGLSVGVLFVGALGLWFSIWRRRRMSRKRLMALEEEEAANARRFGLDPDEVRGPIPFIPRYFPGTIPPSPPPYERDVSETTSAVEPNEGTEPHPVTRTHSMSSPVTIQRLPLPALDLPPPPETRQPLSTPAVSISRSLVSIPTAGAGVSENANNRRLSTGSLILPHDPETEERPVTPTPHSGLVMPTPTRSTPPASFMNHESHEPQDPEMLDSQPPRSIRRRRSSGIGSTGPNSTTRLRREDEMSDTESGELLRSGQDDVVAPYRDEPVHMSGGPGQENDVR